MTGRPSFTKLFQMPDTIVASVYSDGRKPHESNMAQLTPTPMAEPPGTELAKAVPAVRLMKASPKRTPGRETITRGTRATRFQAATITRAPQPRMSRSWRLSQISL